MKSTLTDIVVYSSIVAGIFVMTAPKSQGPALVGKVTNGYARILQAESGQRVTA